MSINIRGGYKTCIGRQSVKSTPAKLKKQMKLNFVTDLFRPVVDFRRECGFDAQTWNVVLRLLNLKDEVDHLNLNAKSLDWGSLGKLDSLALMLFICAKNEKQE